MQQVSEWIEDGTMAQAGKACDAAFFAASTKPG
jgi:hypothetical protein